MLFSKSWIKSMSKVFSLSFWSTSLPDWLVVGPSDTVEVLGLFSNELPLALMMAFKYSNGLLRLNASNSAGDRAMTVSVEGLVALLAMSVFELLLGCSVVC